MRTEHRPQGSSPVVRISRVLSTLIRALILPADLKLRPGMSAQVRRLKSPGGYSHGMDISAETNVFGPVAVTRAMLPLIQKSAAGRVVNISSGLGSLALGSAG